MEERKILRAAANSRHILSKLDAVEIKSSLSDLGQLVYTTIQEFYDKDLEADKADLDIVRDRLTRKVPRQEETIVNFLELISAEDVSNVNILEECITLQKERIGLRLSNALIENDKNIEDLIQQYIDVASVTTNAFNDEESIYQNTPAEELFSEQEAKKGRIKLLPFALNSRLGGGVIGGDNVLIFARPEIGKSLFSINAACGALVQQYKVLYYGNEDAPTRMLRRFVQRLAGMSYEQAVERPAVAHATAFEHGYENLYFVKGERNTFVELRRALDVIEPDILFIDQLRHMVTGNENKVERLEEAAVAARSLASIYEIPVISVTQAGDSAENKLNLTQGDVDYSNTGIPGAMDVMIGIGANEEYLNRNMRRISLPKNKLTGIHDSFDIVVNEQLSKVVEK